MQNTFNFKQVLIWLILILCAGVGYSQQYASIYLKNGDRLRGRWLGADEKSARIEVYNQRLSIPFREIINITPFDDLRLIPDAIAAKHFRDGEAFLQLGMREKAKNHFMAAIEAFPRYADAHYQLGLLFQAEGNNDEALKYFSRVAKINPEAYNMATQFKEASDAYLAAEEYRKAVDAYLLLFHNYPYHQSAEQAAYTAGFLLTEKLDEPEEGLAGLQKAVTEFPISEYLERALYLIGLLQTELGQGEMAVETLRSFILNYPGSQWLAEAYLARGDAYLQLRQNKDAIADFNFVYEHTANLKMKHEARKKRDESAWTIYRVSDDLPSNQIQAIAVDGETLWIGTPKGLAQIDVSMESWQPMTNIVGFINTMFDETNPINVRALAVDEQELWIGTLNNGVIRYNKLTQISQTYGTRDGLPHNTIYDIKIDKDKDEVWIGTFSGVAHYHRSTEQWTVYNKKDDLLPAADIVALAVTPERVWIGTSEGGMAVYDRKLNYWQNFGGPLDDLKLRPDSAIVSFDVGRNQIFFTWYHDEDKSNGYGVIQLDTLKSQVQKVISGDLVPHQNIYVAVSKNADKIEESLPEEMEESPPREMEKPSTLWLATNDGVYIKHSGSWEGPIGFPADRLGVLVVSCIALGEDAAWIGTSNGVAKIDTSVFYAHSVNN